MLIMFMSQVTSPFGQSFSPAQLMQLGCEGFPGRAGPSHTQPLEYNGKAEDMLLTRKCNEGIIAEEM